MGQEGLRMNCIKCGISVQEPQVFCDRCLEDMEKYPVKPNIVVKLPVRPSAAPVKKKARRQKGTMQEEQLRHMRFKLRLAHTALIVVLVCFLVVTGMMLKLLSDSDQQYATGQNYGTMANTDPT